MSEPVAILVPDGVHIRVGDIEAGPGDVVIERGDETVIMRVVPERRRCQIMAMVRHMIPGAVHALADLEPVRVLRLVGSDERGVIVDDDDDGGAA